MPLDRDSSPELSLELPQAHGRGVTPGSKVVGKLNDSDRLGHVLIVSVREHAVKGCPGAAGTQHPKARQVFLLMVTPPGQKPRL